MHFDAAIFDFDETMVNLERQHHDASHALCRELGSDYLEMPYEFRHSSGRRVVDDVAEMIRFFGWTRSLDDLYERRQALFLDECRRSEIEPLPGVLKTVEELHSRGLRLGIASSGIPASIEEILQRFGIRDRFQVIVAGDQVRSGKPDPEIYLTTASKLNVLPEQCVVFEDSEVGVRAAKAAGMYCIAVRNPRARIRQDLSAADREVATFTEVDL